MCVQCSQDFCSYLTWELNGKGEKLILHSQPTDTSSEGPLVVRQGVLVASCLDSCSFVAPSKGLLLCYFYYPFVALTGHHLSSVAALALVFHWELHFPEFLFLKD